MRIRDLRNEFGLTQEELGKKIGQTKSNISKYETGSLEPGIDTIKELARTFDVSVDYLMGVSDVRNPYKDDQGKHPLPESFETPEEAMEFILKQKVIMGYGGFDAEKLTDEQKVDFANELLEHLKLLSYKYKK